MELNRYNYEVNISDNWGWYIDTENLLPINNFEESQSIKLFKKPKYFDIRLNKLDKIVEEYEYEFVKNSTNFTNYNINNDFLDTENQDETIFCIDKIVKIGSTTIMSLILLTYIILFIL